jgi:hypothetical protein
MAEGGKRNFAEISASQSGVYYGSLIKPSPGVTGARRSSRESSTPAVRCLTHPNVA